MKIFISVKSICLSLVVVLLFVQFNASAQITSYQYRHVANDKIDEFIKRETTYWSKVAENAAKNKTMTFWALLEKVDGYDMPNSSNFLFINTFPDIDKAGDAFKDAEKIAGVKMAQMETNSISTTTSKFFLHDEGWAQAAKADPTKDFNYVVMVYHNTDYPDSLVNMEKEYWSPFIKKAMDNGQTSMKGWGDAIVLSPKGDNIKFTTVSYDLYKTLQDALMPKWDPKTEFPSGLDMIGKIELNRRGTVVYRVVKVVSSSN